MQIGPAVWEQ